MVIIVHTHIKRFVNLLTNTCLKNNQSNQTHIRFFAFLINDAMQANRFFGPVERSADQRQTYGLLMDQIVARLSRRTPST